MKVNFAVALMLTLIPDSHHVNAVQLDTINNETLAQTNNDHNIKKWHKLPYDAALSLK